MDEEPTIFKESMPQKNVSLENLSKDVLIQKYKAVLNIARKAKQAKDEYAQENKNLLEKLNKFENDENKNSLHSAMQEIIENLTEDKLKLTNKLCDVQSLNTVFQKKINEQEAALSKLNIENDALKQKENQLSQKNELLLHNLNTTENKLEEVNRLNVRQQEQLALLEQEVAKWKEFEEITNKHQSKLDEITKENEELKIMCKDSLKLQYKLQETEKESANLENEIENQISNYCEKCLESKNVIKLQEEQINQLIKSEKLQSEKIMIIKCKLKKVGSKIKNLNKSRKMLLETIQEYSDSISYWRRDLCNASEKLVERISHLEKDNIALAQENKLLITEQGLLKNENKNLQQFLKEIKNFTNSHVLETVDYKIKFADLITHSEEALKEFDKWKNEYEELILKLNKTQENKPKQNVDHLIKVEEFKEKLTQLKDNFEEPAQTQSKVDEKCKKTTSNVGHINSELLQNENDKSLKEMENIGTKNMYKQNIRDSTEILQPLENEIHQEQTDKKQNIQLSVLADEDTEKDDKGQNQFENVVIDYQNQIKLMEEEKQSINAIIKKLEKRNEILENDYKLKENQIELIKTQFEKYKNEVEQKKNSNVLNLEINAYEKSLNEISKQLAERDNQVDKLKKTLNTEKSVRISLQEQINLLEAAIESEKTHSRDLKQQIDNYQTQIKNADLENHELKTQTHDLTAKYKNLKSEFDTFRLQNSEVLLEKENLLDVLQNDKKQLLRNILQLEELLKSEQQKLKQAKNDLEDLQESYMSYKIKVKAVLKQDRVTKSDHEKELEEENTALNSFAKTLELQIKDLKDKLENNDREIIDLRLDNENVQKRCKELVNLLEELQQQNCSLLAENDKKCHEYQEALKAHQLKIEILTNSYEKQIDDIKIEHSREIAELNKYRKNGSKDLGYMPRGESNNENKEEIDISLIEREDAEGSEMNLTISNKNNNLPLFTEELEHNFISLDELLNSNSDKMHNNEITEITIPSRRNTENIESKMIASEDNVKHLMLLLAETEQDLAKQTQLNDFLKEEVRKHHRTVDREAYMLNFEYIKNVVLKFLTLTNSDERSRLIPVLDNIFKLSNDEKATLQAVIKGSAYSSSSWSSYFSNLAS